MTNGTLRFFAAGEPRTQGSKRGFAIRRKNAQRQWEYTGQVAYSEGGSAEAHKKYKAWRQAVMLAAIDAKNAQGWQTADCPLVVTAHFYLERPKNPRFTVPATDLDLDKLIRLICDAMKDAGIYVNDNRVCSFANCDKLYADHLHSPGVEVFVKELNERQI